MLRSALRRLSSHLCSSAGQEVPSLHPVLTALSLLDVASTLAVQQMAWTTSRVQQVHTSGCLAAVSATAQQPQHFLRLDRLTTAPGSRKQAKRWGRGNGGDRGSYCGRGVKGQKARKGTPACSSSRAHNMASNLTSPGGIGHCSFQARAPTGPAGAQMGSLISMYCASNKPHLLFDGGQKQLRKYPKVWLTPSSPVLYKQVSLGKVLRWVHLGLLDPNEVITMKDLRDSNCASKTIRWGAELVATGKEQMQTPLHIQVSSVSPKAQAVVEAAGGSVTRVYYTRLGLRALLKPENFAKKGRLLPRPVRAWPPRDNGKFDVIGQIPPLKQLHSAHAPVQQQAV